MVTSDTEEMEMVASEALVHSEVSAIIPDGLDQELEISAAPPSMEQELDSSSLHPHQMTMMMNLMTMMSQTHRQLPNLKFQQRANIL